MSMSEYQDKFIELSRYAPADVADDTEKQDHFQGWSDWSYQVSANGAYFREFSEDGGQCHPSGACS
jgi:hypothetical protein